MHHQQISRLHRMFFSMIFAAPFLGWSAAATRAAVVTANCNVTIDTASLIADSVDQPFALYVGLLSGGAPGVSNTDTLSNFSFGAGAPGDGTTILTNGDASGSLSSIIALDTNVSGSFNSFQQDFTAGTTLSFQLGTTEDLVDPSVSTPDELAIAIFDQTGTPLPTTDPSGADSLISLTYQSLSLDLETYGSDNTRQTTGDQTVIFNAPVVTSVPEPTSFVVLAIAGIIVFPRVRPRL